MASRVALIMLALLVAFVLVEGFDVSKRLAFLIGLVPFALAEAKGLVGPYERSARDMMHDAPDSKDRK